MGCNTSAVVPLSDSDLEDSTGIKVRVNPSTPENGGHAPGKKARRGVFIRKSTSPTALESSEPPEELLTKDFNEERRVPPPPPLAFEIPIHENGDGIVRKHPPKRLRLSEANRSDSRELTREDIEEKQAEAEERRNGLLALKIQSAARGNNLKPRRLVHSDAVHQESEEMDDDDDGSGR